MAAPRLKKTVMKKSIYQQAKDTMSNEDISSHASDLYLKRTEQSTKLVEGYDFRRNVKTFRSQIDGKFWYEIPFAYDPFWEKRMTK